MNSRAIVNSLFAVIVILNFGIFSAEAKEKKAKEKISLRSLPILTSFLFPLSQDVPSLGKAHIRPDSKEAFVMFSIPRQVTRLGVTDQQTADSLDIRAEISRNGQIIDDCIMSRVDVPAELRNLPSLPLISKDLYLNGRYFYEVALNGKEHISGKCQIDLSSLREDDVIVIHAVDSDRQRLDIGVGELIKLEPPSSRKKNKKNRKH